MRATRRGFSFVELAVVLAVIGLLMLPLSAMLVQFSAGSTMTRRDIAAEEAVTAISAKLEHDLRTATRANGSGIDIATPSKITFDAYAPQQAAGTLPDVVSHTYELRADKLFYVDGRVFPDGLAAGIITAFSFPSGAGLQQLAASPYDVTFRVESASTTGGATVSSQKTVFLPDY